MENKQALWTKDFIFICLTNLLMFTSFYFLLPTLPVYVTNTLKGDESSVGYVIGILSLTAVLVRPFSGYLLDAVGRKKILLFALIAYCIVTAAYHAVTGLVILFLLRAIHGMTWGFTTTGAGTVASDVVPPVRRGEGMGYYGLSNTLAMALGPSLGLAILNYSGFSLLFSGSLLLAFGALLCVFGIDYDESAHKGGEMGQEKPAFGLNSLFERQVFSLSGNMFFIAIVYGGIVSFITLYGKENGIQNAGSYFLIFALTLLIVRPWAGKSFDRKGPRQIMAIGYSGIAAALVLLFLSHGYTGFVLSAVMMGVGFGIVQPTLMAMAINRVPPYRRGAANGTVLSAFDLGIGLGSIVLGYIAKMVGLHTMYLFCSVVVVIPAVLFFLIEGARSETAPS
ncbi:MFS transporter [Heliobacterium chlorum]|uniref:MFS transporter n=1 Tax=Heliobacterium chlorum TaxID=2698 RepID=A0ABR7T3F2_HELCL|nr:MFS transporter [Heliobacterium chlorum]MBC9784737.1 MFS transporter [Heliobacterium chlorum]